MRNAELLKWTRLLGVREIARLKREATDADKISTSYQRKAKKILYDSAEQALEFISVGADPSRAIRDLEDMLIDHMTQSIVRSLEGAQESVPEDRAPTQRLAKTPPKTRIPRKLDDLRRMWDDLRHKSGRVKGKAQDKLDARAKRDFDVVKKQYLKKVQSVWEKHGAAWRSGEAGTKQAAIEAMKKATKSTDARVRTIIETETTYYFNEARETYYSASDVVTHYLFLAVRDHATTKWCRSRHGKVFEKGTLLFMENIPPCHYNCRSEIVPLTMFNPAHKAIILDMSRRATRTNIVPLMPGWKGGRAA